MVNLTSTMKAKMRFIADGVAKEVNYAYVTPVQKHFAVHVFNEILDLQK